MKLKQYQCIRTRGDEGNYYWEVGHIWEECPFSLKGASRNIIYDVPDCIGVRSITNSLIYNKILPSIGLGKGHLNNYEFWRDFVFLQEIEFRDSKLYKMYLKELRQLANQAIIERRKLTKRISCLNKIILFDKEINYEKKH